MKRASGFTIIELTSCLVLLCIIGGLIFLQKGNLDASQRDQERKTSVNAIYYGLKEAYLPAHQSYPVSIDSKTLPYVDPRSFEKIGDNPLYKMHYRGLDCEADTCKKFEIKIRLEKEAEYKKLSD